MQELWALGKGHEEDMKQAYGMCEAGITEGQVLGYYLKYMLQDTPKNEDGSLTLGAYNLQPPALEQIETCLKAIKV